MQRIFNSLENQEVVTIMPGEYYISSTGEMISTLLGSCIAVCLFDKMAGIGGMNHFLLPKSQETGEAFTSARYGVTAMETLILEMQLRGAFRERMAAKVFGGGNVLTIRVQSESVGERNIRFIEDYLKTESIPVLNSDTGGEFSRKVLFDTKDFKVRLTKTPVSTALARGEKEYLDRISKMQHGSQVIYF